MASIEDHPSRRAEIERLFDEYLVDWEFDPAFPIDQIDEKRSFANQARVDQPIQPDLVETYIESKKQGDAFPAIVIHKDGPRFVNVDGNHRYAADKKVGNDIIPVYKIKAKAETIRVLMTLLNVLHGRGLSEEEKLWHAFFLIDSGTSHVDAARVLHLPLTRLRSAWSLEQANRRSRELGLNRTRWSSLNQSVRLRLASINTDAAFKRMFDLTVKGDLKSDEVTRMVAELNKLRSEQAQLDFIADEEQAIRDRIQSTAGGKVRRMQSPKQQLKMHLGAIAKLDMGTIPGMVTDEEGGQIAEICLAASEALTRLADQLTAGVSTPRV